MRVRLHDANISLSVTGTQGPPTPLILFPMLPQLLYGVSARLRQRFGRRAPSPYPSPEPSRYPSPPFALSYTHTLIPPPARTRLGRPKSAIPGGYQPRDPGAPAVSASECLRHPPLTFHFLANKHRADGRCRVASSPPLRHCGGGCTGARMRRARAPGAGRERRCPDPHVCTFRVQDIKAADVTETSALIRSAPCPSVDPVPKRGQTPPQWMMGRGPSRPTH